MNDFDTFKKLPKNVEDMGKLFVAKGLKKLPKVKQIAQSGNTEHQAQLFGFFKFELLCEKDEFDNNKSLWKAHF